MSDLDPTTLVPSTDDPLTSTDALTAMQNALTGQGSELDFVIGPDPNRGQPVGRSWQFDHSSQGFVKAPGALSPLMTSDMETLKGWVEKCLRTARGAHPVHPPGYGLVTATSDLIGTPVGQLPPDLLGRIEDALTFHPRITGCENFTYDFDPDDDAVFITFTIVLDDETELRLNRVGLVF